MSSTNSPGRLRFEAEFGVTTLRACRGEGEYEERVASTWGGPDEDVARRLVACWNALEGFATEDIEAGAIERLSSTALRADCGAIRLQRAVDALAATETYLQERVAGNPGSRGATVILPMIRAALEGAGVAPTQTSWSDCGDPT